MIGDHSLHRCIESGLKLCEVQKVQNDIIMNREFTRGLSRFFALPLEKGSVDLISYESLPSVCSGEIVKMPWSTRTLR